MTNLDAVITRLDRALCGDNAYIKDWLLELGLDAATLRCVTPNAAFDAVVARLSTVPDTVLRLHLAQQIFGRLGLEVLRAEAIAGMRAK